MDAPDVIDVPGGTAEFYADEDLTVGQTRDLELLGVSLVPVFSRIVDAESEGVSADLTDEEIAEVWLYNYEAVLTYLAGWTLDRPLPASIEDLRGLPTELRMALASHAGKLAVARRAGFGVGRRGAS